MIAYFDASALVPLLIEEASGAGWAAFWKSLDSAVATRLTYVETSSALARAERGGRITPEQHADARVERDALWSRFDVLEVDDRVMHLAARFARDFGLRGYDAVHCAAASELLDTDFVAASGDARLLAAWQQLGVPTTAPSLFA